MHHLTFVDKRQLIGDEGNARVARRGKVALAFAEQDVRERLLLVVVKVHVDQLVLRENAMTCGIFHELLLRHTAVLGRVHVRGVGGDLHLMPRHLVVADVVGPFHQLLRGGHRRNLVGDARRGAVGIVVFGKQGQRRLGQCGGSEQALPKSQPLGKLGLLLGVVFDGKIVLVEAERRIVDERHEVRQHRALEVRAHLVSVVLPLVAQHHELVERAEQVLVRAGVALHDLVAQDAGHVVNVSAAHLVAGVRVQVLGELLAAGFLLVPVGQRIDGFHHAVELREVPSHLGGELAQVIVHLQVAGLFVELGYDLRNLALDVVELPLDLGKLRYDLR